VSRITSSRKLDHIRVCLERAVECEIHSFDDLSFVHKALPELDWSEIDCSTSFLGRKISAPLMISAMTGGHPETKEINANLALAAQEIGIAIGVGSQRAAIEDPTLEDTFSVVRDCAPDVPIVGNIGAVQLSRHGPEILDRVAEMIEADAVAIHLNYLQECIQPEGEVEACGVLEAIKSAADSSYPLIVKETGAGICYEEASAIVKAGIGIIDVAGCGGTSWSAVEAFRAKDRGDLESQEIGELFRCWGMPTPVCLVECLASGAEAISSGGVRSGLDVARSVALGASIAGVALPLLAAATRGHESVASQLRSYIRALRITMLLTGSASISQLQGAPLLILGRTREILEQRGFNTRRFSVRSELSR